MAYRKKVKKKSVPIPGYDKMIRAKRMAEVQMFQEDLKQAEMRRNTCWSSEISGQLFMGIFLQVFNTRYIPDETRTKRWFSNRSKLRTSSLHYSSAVNVSPRS